VLTLRVAQELNARALDQPRLRIEIDRIRNEIDPFIDSPWPEPPARTKRRNDIESRMISKKLVADLVDRGAGEQELQKLLKQDLSIFAEIYANPKEEYICFSEFLVADGTVDFTVFSGRSGMDVTLIEVKGANFYLVNQGHYDKFSGKIEEAVDQIRKRLTYIPFAEPRNSERKCTEFIRMSSKKSLSTTPYWDRLVICRFIPTRASISGPSSLEAEHAMILRKARSVMTMSGLLIHQLRLNPGIPG
jgi:hypothetical protein